MAARVLLDFTKSGTVVSGTGGIFASDTGTFLFLMPEAQSIVSLTYYNLTLANSGTKTL